MFNLNYSFIEINYSQYIYNNLTGLYYEINQDSRRFIEDINWNVNNQHNEIYESLINEYYVTSGNFDFVLDLYPSISPYVVWDNNNISYRIANNNFVIPISEFDKRCFKASNGVKSVSEIINELNISFSDYMMFMSKWVSSDAQVIKLFKTKYDNKYSIYFYYFLSPSTKHDEIEMINHENYYSNIEDAEEQFEVIETTISYLMREDTGVLKAGKYGSEFAKKTLERIDTLEKYEVLEVGGGLGDFANSFIEYFKVNGIKLNYSIVDISPTLIQEQAKKCKEYSGIMTHFLESAEELVLDKKQFDIIISNEVIADLTNNKIYDSQGNINNGLTKGIIEEFGLHTLVGNDSYLNIGAINFISKIDMHLKKNGIAILTEFTETDGSSQITNCITDHSEVSINFELLKHVAEAKGFVAKIVNLNDFLDFSPDEMILSPDSFNQLKNLVNKYNKELKKLIYTEKYISEFYSVENIQFCKLSRLTKYFKALILSK